MLNMTPYLSPIVNLLKIFCQRRWSPIERAVDLLLFFPQSQDLLQWHSANCLRTDEDLNP